MVWERSLGVFSILPLPVQRCCLGIPPNCFRDKRSIHYDRRALKLAAFKWGSNFMEEFKDRVAIVTGSAQSIGFTVAETLGDSGCKVILADIRPDRLQES